MYLLTTETSKDAKFLFNKMLSMGTTPVENSPKEDKSENDSQVEQFKKIDHFDTYPIGNYGYLNTCYDMYHPV